MYCVATVCRGPALVFRLLKIHHFLSVKPNGGGPVSTTGYHPGGPVQATTDVTHSLLPQPQMATGAGVTAPPPPPPTHTQAAPQQVETGHTTQGIF